jgi:hypothetical protein
VITASGARASSRSASEAAEGDQSAARRRCALLYTQTWRPGTVG